MWAGSRVEFLAPMTVGAALTRVTTIDAIKPKRGASGDLLFVTLRHEISADGVAALREEQDIVFREAARATPAPTAAPATPAPDTADAVRRLTPDPLPLFRYSALPCPANPIHSDPTPSRAPEYSA